MPKMIKKKAINIVCSFLYNHLESGNFWNDYAYIEEIKALKILGWHKEKTNNKKNI